MFRIRPAILAAAAWLGLLASQLAFAQQTDPFPVDAVDAVLKAFDAHPIVAVGDLHGCQELHDFIDSLVRNPGFPNTVNDVVVEFGNALYQDVADRYVAGEDVPASELRLIWRNHTNPIVFDSPVYERFLTSIRQVNETLEEGKRIRVLLGDPPIDWSNVETNKDWGRMLFQRDSHFAEVVDRAALSKGRRALLLLGGAHLVRGVDQSNVTGRIESQYPGAMFIVIPHSGFGSDDENEELEPRLADWKPGTLALLKNTWLGALPPRLRWPQMTDVDARLEDVADAWLYVGPRDDLTEALPFPGIYRDDYWNELNRRELIMWGKPLDSSDQFNARGRYAR